MGIPLFLESALELDDIPLEAGSLLQQLVNTPGGFFQFRCSFLVHVLYVFGRQRISTSSYSYQWSSQDSPEQMSRSP
jgi:hypothetical protein